MSERLPGTEVEARGLRWEVVFSERLGPQTLYRLRGLESAITGQELDFLHPFEPLERIVHDFQPERAAPLRHWLVYHQAFLLEQALGGDALLAVQPGRLRLEPYQLVPVLRAIRMRRPRLLLADGVGLGKTIQAGLVLTELMARRVAHRVLVVSPAGPLLEQWRTEMAERFGLRLDVIDRPRLEEIRQASELGTNAFDHLPLGLVSIDFLKQERVLEQLERSSYDVAVIDEAHHCMDLGTAGEYEDSQRRRLAQVLARRCDTLLLLTATPHDGNDRSFASLCELLDPALVDGRGMLRGERYREHVVRRLKRHIRDPNTGADLFKDRLVYPIAVTPSPAQHPAYIELQHALLDLIAPELRSAFRARRYSDVLSFIALLRKLERFGTATAEEEAERSLLEAEDLAQRLADLQREVRTGSRRLKRTADVVAALDDLISLAEMAAREDPKLQQLVTTASDTTSARLLQGLLEEDARIFQPEDTLFDFASTDEAEGADVATRELLEEIDRSLKGFERATRMHHWLGEAGLHADTQLLSEASAARGRGDRVGAVDLARFVTDAIRLDGGEVVGSAQGEIFEAVLPPAWTSGLEALPGYDTPGRRVRLTTRLEITVCFRSACVNLDSHWPTVILMKATR